LESDLYCRWGRKRVDTDGVAYTQAEFLQFHGNLDAWNAAAGTAIYGPIYGDTITGLGEAPMGVKDMGGYTISVYSAEQMARLGVDEYGVAIGTIGLAGQDWTWDGSAEAPAGVKDMGGYIIRVYSAEQMARLGVDESGYPVAGAWSSSWNSWSSGSGSGANIGQEKRVDTDGFAYTQDEFLRFHGNLDAWNAAAGTAYGGSWSSSSGPVEGSTMSWSSSSGPVEGSTMSWSSSSGPVEGSSSSSSGQVEGSSSSNSGQVEGSSSSWSSSSSSSTGGGAVSEGAGGTYEEIQVAGYQIAVYTEEQQQRLGVDEYGNPV